MSHACRRYPISFCVSGSKSEATEEELQLAGSSDPKRNRLWDMAGFSPWPLLASLGAARSVPSRCLLRELAFLEILCVIINTFHTSRWNSNVYKGFGLDSLANTDWDIDSETVYLRISGNTGMPQRSTAGKEKDEQGVMVSRQLQWEAPWGPSGKRYNSSWQLRSQG